MGVRLPSNWWTLRKSCGMLFDMKQYDHRKIEKKWQKVWEKEKLWQAKDNTKQPKFYGLIEFPYPSGQGLHIGHIRSNTAMDIICRKRRAEGFNVLYPIGWDAFGLPTENYAVKTGIQPAVVTKKNTNIFCRQLKALGFSFDWSREIDTSSPEYYKWTQWIFLKFFEKGLAYKKKFPINWCLSCKIGLANEEVIDGKCQRCGGPTEKREKEQWMLAITKYADRLDKDLDGVDYLEEIKTQQRNWIGRSEGSEIEFKISPTPALPKGEGGNPILPSREEWGEFGYFTTDKKLWRLLQEKVLEMRKNATQTENILWQSIRKNLTGYHFRRQQIVGNFIVDFVCLEKLLVIEVDGDIHDYQKKEDFERTEFLKQKGFRVIRFRNEEILENLEKVMEKITRFLKALSFGEGLGGALKVFTTRADTLFGATYLVLSPEHSEISNHKFQITNWGEVEKYIDESKKKTEIERMAEGKEKTGVELKGIKSVNPANGEEIPIFVADYVLPDYGTGAIMAVPAHDERDWQFAKKYGLPIRQVVAPLVTRVGDEDAWRKNEPEVKRETVVCLVKHWSENKFLFLKKKLVDKAIVAVAGGTDGEDLIIAGQREIREETGFLNSRYIKNLGSPVFYRFFSVVSKQNRISELKPLYFELTNGEKEEISEEEKKQHDSIWLSEYEIEHYLVGRPFSPIFWNRLKGVENAYIGEGILINSGKFNGLESKDAARAITEFVSGKITTKYKLRDWVFSRQRYWGEPIPLIFCEKDNWVAVPEKDLPVRLPKVKDFKPTESGESPLAQATKWVNVKCPKCGAPAKRETDTMPNWAGSSWYYLAYCISENLKSQAPISKQFSNSKIQNKLKYWTPVDWYNGGMEHVTLHLLYSRFWHKFLFDLGLTPTNEPYKKRTAHGLILAEGGVKMSKSKGNVINPDDLVERFGADALRVYEMFMGPFAQAINWNTDGMVGTKRFLEKVWRIEEKLQTPSFKFQTNHKLQFLINQTIKKVTEDIEAMRFNTAISALMILTNEMDKLEKIAREDFEILLRLLAPFAPHITEELWAGKKSIHLSPWPKYDAAKIQEATVKITIQVNGKTRGTLEISRNLSQGEIERQAADLPEIAKWLVGKNIKKIIFVPARLLNFVIA